jgi:VanZ family protein
MQTYLTTTRHGDWFDWLADTIGIVVGLGLFLIIRRYVRI